MSYSQATIAGTEKTSGLATGGTGISGGEAGYNDKLWQQIYALVVK